MPLPQYSPYQEAGMSLNRLGHTMQDTFLDIARMNAQERYRREMLTLRGQQMEEQNARAAAAAEFDAARTRDLNTKRHAAEDIGMFTEQLYGTDPNVNPDVNAMLESMLAGRAGTLAGMGERYTPESIAQLLSMRRNPKMRDVIAAGGADKLYHVTPQGAISTPIAGSGPVIEGGYNLGAGQQRFAPRISGLEDIVMSLGQNRSPVATSPIKPSSPSGTTLSPNNALGALLNPAAEDLDPGVMQGLIEVLKGSLPNRGMTNAPTGRVAPPQMRKVGDKVTTAKGQFQWTGSGWVPVQAGTNDPMSQVYNSLNFR